MDELIPDLVGEKDMKSAWKNKPLKIIGLILLFLIDWIIALIPAGFLDGLFKNVSIGNNLKWLINALYNISFFIIFIICLIILILFEYLIIGSVVFLVKKRKEK